MNARTEMPKAPDWAEIDMWLEQHQAMQRSAGFALAVSDITKQRKLLMNWLAAQPLAPEGGDKDGGGDAPTIDDIVALSKVGPIPSPVYEKMAKAAGLATPPAPAREAVADDLLAACPFCGKSGAAKVHEHGEDDSYTVVCDASTASKLGGCGGACGYQRTPEKAVAAWNRRAHPAAGAVVVDEAAIERACIAHHGAAWHVLGSTAKAAFAEKMRAALTAAIGGAG